MFFTEIQKEIIRLVLEFNKSPNCALKPYITVEVKHGDQCLIEHFLVKNLDDNAFYEITSFYPKTVFYIILGEYVSSFWV
jgi:hypothetical protein